MEIITKSPEESIALAEVLAGHLEPGELILFFGDLGAGKTTFTRGLAQGLGVDADVHSPTFTLIHEHHGRNSLYHVDLYRLEHQEEIDNLGLEEYISSSAVTVIEWSERFEILPERHLKITITAIGDEERFFSFSSDYHDEAFFEAVKKDYNSKCISWE